MYTIQCKYIQYTLVVLCQLGCKDSFYHNVHQLSTMAACSADDNISNALLSAVMQQGRPDLSLKKRSSYLLKLYI